MGALAARFRNWFSFRPAETGPKNIELPSGILNALADGCAAAVQPSIREIAWRDENAQLLDAMLAEARRRGWPELEVVKLEAWVEYHRGKLRQAYAKAEPYLAEERFDADLYVIACLAVYHANQFEEALRVHSCGRGKEHLLGDRLDYWIISSLIFWALGRHADARRAIDQALRVAPTDMMSLGNALTIYLELGDMPALEAVYKALAENYSNSAEAQYALGFADLALGRYRAGFERMEWRYRMVEASRYINGNLLALPRWRGLEEASGKRLLLTAEQGLGDSVMLARYMPEILKLGNEVVLECQPAALPLFTHNFPSLRTLPIDEKMPKVDFDCWLATMSLPYIFGSDVGNIPRTAGYLDVPQESRIYWQQRVSDTARPGKIRIGLTWSGSPIHRADRRRSLPFSRVAEVIKDIDVDFFALQTNVPTERPDNLLDLSEELVTLADTAALIEQMDLVITVDTSVVHVAGAIGHPTWLMLPCRYEWRWGLEGESNHWYDSVRVVRQPANGDWDSVLCEIFGNRLPAFINNFGRRQNGVH